MVIEIYQPDDYLLKDGEIWMLFVEHTALLAYPRGSQHYCTIDRAVRYSLAPPGCTHDLDKMKEKANEYEQLLRDDGCPKFSITIDACKAQPD